MTLVRQRQQLEAEQRENQQEQQQAEVGGGNPVAGGDISSSSGDVEAGKRKPPVHPLVVIPVPPELAGSPFIHTPVDIDHRCTVPRGWERCLDLQTGRIFFKDNMSGKGKKPSLDLRLNLSPYHGSSSGAAGGSSNNNYNHNNNNNNGGRHNNSPHRSSSSSSSSSQASPPSSCVSSETDQEGEASSMVLVGCPHCLMYVMLSEADPRCPKCKSTVLLDFLKNPGASTTGKAKKN